MDKKIDEKSKQMHEKIKDILNTIWIIFREFEETHDMEKYNQRAAELVHKYKEDELCIFCQNLLLTWAPIIKRFFDNWKS